MDGTAILLGFCGGFGLFVYGMHIMASGLQKSAGNKMKQLLEVLTKNRLLAVLVGAGVTAIIQSSSATTVMVVGFVNAGLMNLSQSVGVIMGANIGTTITAWLVAIMGVDFSGILSWISPTKLAPIATIVGAMMVLFFKKKSFTQIGEIVVGIGILFMGMHTMTTSLKPLSASPIFKDMFLQLGSNPLLGVLAGALVTGVIQSSSASVGILQSLALASLVPLNAAVYIIMGQNIGTCITALLSSLGASKNARATAYVHLLFNVIGSVLFSLLAVLFFKFINPNLGNTLITVVGIGIVHSGFNILNTILLFPFADRLVALAEKMVGATLAQPDESQVQHLDDRIIEAPVFAIQSCIKEIVRLGYLALDNVVISLESLLQGNLEKAEKVVLREKSIDVLEKTITQYMVKICNADINENENKIVTSLFHTVHDVERVSDHSENIADLAFLAHAESATISDIALLELRELGDLVIDCYKNSIMALERHDKKLAQLVVEQEQQVDDIEKRLRTAHIRRLQNNECNPTSGVIFLDTLTNLERISDHALNICEMLLKQNSKPKRQPM